MSLQAVMAFLVIIFIVGIDNLVRGYRHLFIKPMHLVTWIAYISCNKTVKLPNLILIEISY